MKSPQVDHSMLPVLIGHRRLSWPRIVLVVVLLSSIFAFVQPAAASVVTQAGSPTDSYGCSGVYHRVRSGETINSIAARYGSTVYRIVSCNGLTSRTVYVGQRLLVPVRKSSSGSWLEGIDFAIDGGAATPATFVDLAKP